MRRLLTLVATIVVVISFASRARASEDDVVIDLVGAAEQPPQFVCVAAPVQDVRPGEEQRPSNASYASEIFGNPGSPCKAPTDIIPNGADPLAAATSPMSWRYGACTEPVTDDPTTQTVAKRVSAFLRAPQNRGVLFNQEEACRPQLELPPKHVVQCRLNSVPGGAGGGVAVITLGFSSVHRSVLFFNVEQNIVTVRLAPTKLPGGTINARLAGGHYQATKVAPVEGRRAQLALEPRCYERELIVPRVDARTPKAEAIVHVDGWKDLTVKTTTLRVMTLVPPTDGGKGTSLKVTFPNEKGDPRPDAVFAASWTTHAPPSRLDLRPTQITFSWRQPCDYPLRDLCPAVRLAEGGGEQPSAPPEGGVCKYRFEAEEGRSLTLPAEVAFDAKTLPSWRGKLSLPASTLPDYLPAESRMIRVTMPWAFQRAKIADQIESVEIVGPTGTRHLLTPEAVSIVGIPFTGCGTRVAYKLNGMRNFRWGSAEIKNGTLEIDSPNETAELASLGLMIGGGFEVSFTRPETRPYAQAELSMRLRLRRWGEVQETPQGVAWAAASWLTRPDYDVTLTYVFTPQPYFPLRTADNQQDNRYETVPYNRFLLGGYVLWPILNTLSFGPGVGFGLGYALKGVDSDRVGGVKFFAVLPAARLRYDISRRFALVATGRVIMPDEIRTFSTANDFRGTPQSTASGQSWFFFDFALQGWL